MRPESGRSFLPSGSGLDSTIWPDGWWPLADVSADVWRLLFPGNTELKIEELRLQLRPDQSSRPGELHDRIAMVIWDILSRLTRVGVRRQDGTFEVVCETRSKCDERPRAKDSSETLSAPASGIANESFNLWDGRFGTGMSKSGQSSFDHALETDQEIRDFAENTFGHVLLDRREVEGAGRAIGLWKGRSTGLDESGALRLGVAFLKECGTDGVTKAHVLAAIAPAVPGLNEKSRPFVRIWERLKAEIPELGQGGRPKGHTLKPPHQ